MSTQLILFLGSLIFIGMIIAHYLHCWSMKLEHKDELLQARRSGYSQGYATGWETCITQIKNSK